VFDARGAPTFLIITFFPQVNKETMMIFIQKKKESKEQLKADFSFFSILSKDYCANFRPQFVFIFSSFRKLLFQKSFQIN
jgi:hypothetical protein